MPTKPPNIVHSDYRPKRARKRKQSVAIPMRIVTAKPPKKHLGGPVQPIGGVQEPAPLPERPRIVTASRKTSTRFGPVQDIDAEEHQRRWRCRCRVVPGNRAPGHGRWRDVSPNATGAAMGVTHYLPAPRRWTNCSPPSRHGSCGSTAIAAERTGSSSRATLTGGICCCAISSNACATMVVAAGKVQLLTGIEASAVGRCGGVVLME